MNIIFKINHIIAFYSTFYPIDTCFWRIFEIPYQVWPIFTKFTGESQNNRLSVKCTGGAGEVRMEEKSWESPGAETTDECTLNRKKSGWVHPLRQIGVSYMGIDHRVWIPILIKSFTQLWIAWHSKERDFP